MSNQRPRFTSRLDRARNAAFALLSRSLKWMSPRARFIFGFAVLVIVTTLLLVTNYSRGTVENYKEGDVVHRTIIAPVDLASVDITETERRRETAKEATRPIFNFYPTRAENGAQALSNAWDDLRKQVEQRGISRKEPVWSGEGGPEVARAIIAHHFDSGELARLMQMIREAGNGYIYEESAAEHLKPEIVLADGGNADKQTIVPIPGTRMIPLSTARRNLWSGIAQLKNWSQEEKTALAAAMLPLLRPTVVYDQATTEAMQNAAASKIIPIPISLKRNQVVAREGDTVTQAMLAQFDTVRAYGRTGRPWHHLFGLLFMVAAIFWAAWKFTEHRSTAVSLTLSPKKAYALIGASVVVQTIFMRVGFTLSDSLAAQTMRPPLNDPTIWNFAIPFAAAALLVVMLVDTQLALIAALIVSLFAGLLAPSGMATAFYAIISSSAAIYGISRYRERQSVTLAGLVVGGANALMAVAVLAYAQQPLTLNTILLAVGCGFLGGLLTAIFTAGGLPINESLFGILTDVKLLELSNADLPVLGQLALRAPGTNQHSHAVGQLAEEACRAVGANPLLARIGALYHDIGKLGAPDYFVENQQGHNPHDRLRPTQSARIITSHVTYGLKLAKEIGLPKQISDFIPQHHGTRTLHFFLRKAQAQAALGEEVDDAEFRYPGPKPQFKETAIMMIADSCEAAARSLARPDPENIRTIVSKIVDAIISDGQLDECNITLRELTTIREAIITALTAIYHARIDYPGFNPPPLTGALPPLPSPELDTEERGVSYSKPSEIPINRGGEVEDEAISRKQ